MADPDEVALVVMGLLGLHQIPMAVGGGIADVVRESVGSNLRTLIKKAHRKKPGRTIEPSYRVASKVLIEGAFTSDDIILEYLAGVMAASGPVDDSGAAIVALIGRLSAAELRMHYLIYRELRRLWPADQPINLYESNLANTAGLAFTFNDLQVALGPGLEELMSAVSDLDREGLIAGYWELGEKGSPPVWSGQVYPTGLGAHLFLWGQGLRGSVLNLFLPDAEIEDLEVPETPNTKLLTPPSAATPGRST